MSFSSFSTCSCLMHRQKSSPAKKDDDCDDAKDSSRGRKTKSAGKTSSTQLKQDQDVGEHNHDKNDGEESWSTGSTSSSASDQADLSLEAHGSAEDLSHASSLLPHEQTPSKPEVSLLPVVPSPPSSPSPSSEPAPATPQIGVSVDTTSSVIEPKTASGSGNAGFGMLALYQGQAAYELGTNCLDL